MRLVSVILVVAVTLCGVVCAAETLGPNDYLHVKLLGQYKQVLTGADALYVSTTSGILGSVSLDSGSVNWRRSHEDDTLGPMVAHAGGIVALANKGSTLRRWSKAGQLLWETALPGTHIDEGSVTAAGEDVYVVTHGKSSHGVSAANGNVMWASHQGGLFVTSVSSENVAVYAAQDGMLVRSILKASDGSMISQASVKLHGAVKQLVSYGHGVVLLDDTLSYWPHDKDILTDSSLDMTIERVAVQGKMLVLANVHEIKVLSHTSSKAMEVKTSYTSKNKLVLIEGQKKTEAVYVLDGDNLVALSEDGTHKTVLSLPHTAHQTVYYTSGYVSGSKVVLVTIGGLVSCYDLTSSTFLWSRPDGLASGTHVMAYHFPTAKATSVLQAEGNVLARWLSRWGRDLSHVLGKVSDRFTPAAESRDHFNFKQGLIIANTHALMSVDTVHGSVLWWRELPLDYAYSEQSAMISQHSNGVSGSFAAVSIGNDAYHINEYEVLTGEVIGSAQLESKPLGLSVLPTGVLVMVLDDKETSDKVIFVGWQHGKFVQLESDVLSTLRAVIVQNDTVTGYDKDGVVYRVFSPRANVVAPESMRYSVLSRRLARGTYVVTRQTPNTMVLISQEDTSSTVITTIDTTNGHVIDRVVHYDDAVLLSAVVCKDKLVYNMWNTETAFSELFVREFVQENGRASVASSSFILPYTTTDMTCTVSNRDITRHDVLITTHQGQIVRLRSKVLDPHRPKTPGGGVPVPELPPWTANIKVDPLAVVTQNVNLEKPAFIQTFPTAMESVSLVVAGGADLFVARVSPSGSFDMLGEHFAYEIVFGTMALGAVALAVVWYMASKKKN